MIPTSNIGHLLTRTAARFPQRVGLIEGDLELTWAQVNQRVDSLAFGLVELGIGPGDRVLVQARNSHRAFELKWAIFKLGAVWVPVNYRLSAPEIAFIASHSGAKAFVCDEVFADCARAAAAASPSLQHIICLGTSSGFPATASEDLVAQGGQRVFREAAVDRDHAAWFFYTSGTTGRPKAAVLTHGQLAFVVANHLADMFPGANEHDTSIVLAPLSHGAGVHALSFVARGAAQVIFSAPSMDPDQVWRLIATHRVTNFFTVPTMLRMLVDHPSVDRVDHSALRFVNYGGAPLLRADLRLALEKLGPVLVQHYGLGEFTAAITCLPPDMQAINVDDGHTPVGTCGYPRTGAQVAILSPEGEELPAGADGEICVRGPAVFAGYHNDPEATAKAFAGGWFHTGDMGHMDERGLLYITGRASDMYISGGLNIYPREAEEIILDDHRVAEVAIVGVPHEKWGESGVAVVVPRNGEALRPQDVLDMLEGRLARFKFPKEVRFWSSLPKSGYGKVLKREIVRQLVNEGHGAEAGPLQVPAR